MICVQLSGGLGNQMFQYACGRALAFKHQTKLLFDSSQLLSKKSGSGITNRSFELGIFNINAMEAKKEDIKKLKPLPHRIANVLFLRTGFQGIQSSKYFVENKYSYNNNIEKIGKNCFLAGYWQSEQYFQNIRSIIKDEFRFKPFSDAKNIQWQNKIENENSVSLHIRRSDFVNNKFHDIHGTCSIEYYLKAAGYISANTTNPFFFVFSDDIEWARKNLNLSGECEYISGNSGENSYMDMQLMSMCKHNIIANSSFSWWGAWLNQNPEKIIISPKQWFIPKVLNDKTVDLIPGTWLRF